MSGVLARRAIHAAYRASLTLAARRFARAARDCERAQAGRLASLVAANESSAYGRAHGFAAVHSWRDYQRRVPIVTYDDLEPWVARAAAGERGVLTTAPVTIFERTSGSSSPNKLVPYTSALLAEFGAATGPWLYDLYSRVPALRGTASYWSVSPVTRARERTPGGTPIGFDDDTDYFGPLARAALRHTLAVPAGVARLADARAWAEATIRHLVDCEELGLISVWHPSFFTLLMRAIESRLDELLDAAPPARAAAVRERLARWPLGRALWPRLAVVSCWTDAAAADAVPALVSYLPHARLQPKGLLATEGVVSLPIIGLDGRSRSVAAVASHFLEFLDLEREQARPLLAHELREGASYAPIISTGGGFYRYRVGDAVRCVGLHGGAPVLRFDGRTDQVSDLCGEKLSARAVSDALRAAQRDTQTPLVFALLAPDRSDVVPRYRLYAERSGDGESVPLALALDTELSRNHGYRYARALGQLAPLAIVLVRDGAARYHRALLAAGRKAGDIKPAHLDTRGDWRAVFEPSTVTVA
ncbi:MAG: GH3 auxin-responsive promoter family protein [Gemmatimonadaceae bacterium]